MRILILVIALLACAPSFGLTQDLRPAPVNPAFEAYIQQRSARTARVEVPADRPTGYIPSLRPAPAPRTSGLRARLALPSSFDLRAQGKVTPVRNQGECGACWAFSTMAAIESELAASGGPDLSENNLKNRHGFVRGPCDGGNYDMAVAYLARNGGPVYETDDPYSETGRSPDGLPPRKRVHEVDYLPGRGDSYDVGYVAALKQAVVQGAVATMMLWDPAYFDRTTSSYYFHFTPGSGSAYIAPALNHAVTVVGWDDAHPRSSFPDRPPGDGAFLVKNSWGTDWGDRGYFWISYHDMRLAAEWSISTSGTTSPTVYDRAYGHDELGWVLSYGYGSDTAWLGAKFQASGEAQALEAFGVYTQAAGASYEVRVLLSPDGDGPGGAPVLTETGMVPSAGFHAVRLRSPVRIAAGQRFSVIVKLTQPGTAYPIAVETFYPGYAENVSVSPDATFASLDGVAWTDMAAVNTPFSVGANVCLKAFCRSLARPLPVGVLKLLAR